MSHPKENIKLQRSRFLEEVEKCNVGEFCKAFFESFEKSRVEHLNKKESMPLHALGIFFLVVQLEKKNLNLKIGQLTQQYPDDIKRTIIFIIPEASPIKTTPFITPKNFLDKIKKARQKERKWKDKNIDNYLHKTQQQF